MARAIIITADSRRPSVCRRCGQAIVYASTLPGGSLVAFDPPITLMAGLPFYTTTNLHRAERVDVTATRLHRETCRGRGGYA